MGKKSNQIKIFQQNALNSHEASALYQVLEKVILLAICKSCSFY